MGQKQTNSSAQHVEKMDTKAVPAGSSTRVEKSDFDVIVGETRFPCHAYVLASFSDYFRDLFAKKAHAKSITLNKPDLDTDTFDIMLKFMYTGTLAITSKNTHALLINAHYLGIPCIIKECKDFIKNNTRVDNIWDICTYFTNDMEDTKFGKKVTKIIVKNFEQVLYEPDFLNTPFPILQAVLNKLVEPKQVNVALRHVKKQAFPFIPTTPASTKTRKLDEQECKRMIEWIYRDLYQRTEYYADFAIYAKNPENMVNMYHQLIEDFGQAHKIKTFEYEISSKSKLYLRTNKPTNLEVASMGLNVTSDFLVKMTIIFVLFVAFLILIGITVIFFVSLYDTNEKREPYFGHSSEYETYIIK